MAVARALQAAGGALRRNSSIVGVVLAFMLAQLPVQFAQLLGPTAAVAASGVTVVLSLVLVPFVFAGMLGMAAEALDGTTSLGTFVAAGKRHYTSMLVAYGLLLVGAIVFGIVSSILFAVVSVGVFAPLASGGALNPSTFGIVAPVVLVAFVLLWFLPLFFVQFYGQAIVLDGAGALGGFKRSVGVVRRNLLSVFGYSVVVFIVGLVLGLLTSIPSTLISAQRLPAATFPDLPLSLLAGLAVAGNVLMALFGSFFLVFSVAFYRSLDRPGDADGPESLQSAVA
jgi:hypothetical protein